MEMTPHGEIADRIVEPEVTRDEKNELFYQGMDLLFDSETQANLIVDKPKKNGVKLEHVLTDPATGRFVQSKILQISDTDPKWEKAMRSFQLSNVTLWYWPQRVDNSTGAAYAEQLNVTLQRGGDIICDQFTMSVSIVDGTPEVDICDRRKMREQSEPWIGISYEDADRLATTLSKLQEASRGL